MQYLEPIPRIRKGIGDIGGDHQGLALRDGRVLQEAVLQAFTFDIQHDQVVVADILTGFEGGHDIRMVQAAKRAYLVCEPLDILLVAGQFGREHFQRHFAVHGELNGQIDLAHGAAAQGPFDPASADYGAALKTGNGHKHLAAACGAAHIRAAHGRIGFYLLPAIVALEFDVHSSHCPV